MAVDMSAHRLLLILLVLLCALPLAADDREAQRAAAALLQEANEAFDDGIYDLALEGFKEAYEIYPHEGFHGRIGAAYQAMGEHERAIERFELFLRVLPDAPNRAEIEEMLAFSREELDGDDLPLIGLVPADEDAEQTDESSDFDALDLSGLDPDEMEDQQPGAIALDLSGEEPVRETITKDPLYGQWWFWAAIGASAALAGGAIYAGTRPETVIVLPTGSLGAMDWR